MLHKQIQGARASELSALSISPTVCQEDRSIGWPRNAILHIELGNPQVSLAAGQDREIFLDDLLRDEVEPAGAVLPLRLGIQ